MLVISHYEPKTIFQEKHIISRIMYFFQKTLLFYVIFFCGNKLSNLLWLCVPRTFFLGQRSDTISLAVLTLGVRVVMFSSEGAEVIATDALSWLSYIISSELLTFRSTHDTEAGFHPPQGSCLLNYDQNEILLTLEIHSNMFWSQTIASNQLIKIVTPPPPASLISIAVY